MITTQQFRILDSLVTKIINNIPSQVDKTVKHTDNKNFEIAIKYVYGKLAERCDNT